MFMLCSSYGTGADENKTPAMKVAPPKANAASALRPLLKWAGGKTQMLDTIVPKLPSPYGRYIEPFFGGGALFFAVAPQGGIIADSNPELINLYQAVADDVAGVIAELSHYENRASVFYEARAQDWTQLPGSAAAARTLFLNHACFNGLYRVNRSGHFNVPFGYYKNPRILDEDALIAASSLLRNTTILCGDYRDVLATHARRDDFIFLDPPYLPISEYSDFRRYTKEPFYEQDHVQLASEVQRLQNLGCHVILTNSNHPLVHQQYQHFSIEIVQTRRPISCKGQGRNSEDVIVTVLPKPGFDRQRVPGPLPAQARRYPSTRYMGSKNKLLAEIWTIAAQFEFDTVLDLFSGSGVVSYLFKAHGKTVVSNDYMAMAATFAQAMIANNTVTLPLSQACALMDPGPPTDRFVETRFQGLYFSDEDNRLIDVLRANIKAIRSPLRRAIAMSALIRACLKKRPRGIFTYVGQRYDDGRRDLQMTFRAQFLEAVDRVNAAIFDNGQRNRALHKDAMDLKIRRPGLVYMDPPYYSPLSDSEYVRRYHFVEGLARDWQGVEIQEHTVTRKFKSYPTPFATRRGATAAFDTLFRRFRDSVLLVSYSSNSQPTLDEMVALMARHKRHVEVVPVNYQYCFGNQGHKDTNPNNAVQEYLFVGY